MPLYESVFIARQDIPAQEVETLTERLEGIVAEQGGTVARREYWGLKNLAYRIKKNRKGHFTLLHLDSPAAAVQELERNMRISEDVLRYMTVRLDALPEGPTVMMQSRSSREDRGRREDRRPRRSAESAGGESEAGSSSEASADRS